MNNYNREAEELLGAQLAYETSFLDEVYGLLHTKEALEQANDAVVYYKPGQGTQIKRYIYATANFRNWRPDFLKLGQPLIFIVIVKLIDSIIEWMLRTALQKEPPLQHVQKIEALERIQNSGQLPPIFTSNQWLLDVLTALYKHLYAYRNTVTHRWEFNISSDGGLHVEHSKDRNKPALILKADLLVVLADFLVRIVKILSGAWRLDEYQERHMKFLTDKLSCLHGMQRFNQKPVQLTNIVYVVPWGGRADVATIENYLNNNAEEIIIDRIVVASMASENDKKIAYRLTSTEFHGLPGIFDMEDVSKVGSSCAIPEELQGSI